MESLCDGPKAEPKENSKSNWNDVIPSLKSIAAVAVIEKRDQIQPTNISCTADCMEWLQVVYKIQKSLFPLKMIISPSFIGDPVLEKSNERLLQMMQANRNDLINTVLMYDQPTIMDDIPPTLAYLCEKEGIWGLITLLKILNIQCRYEIDGLILEFCYKGAIKGNQVFLFDFLLRITNPGGIYGENGAISFPKETTSTVDQINNLRGWLNYAIRNKANDVAMYIYYLYISKIPETMEVPYGIPFNTRDSVKFITMRLAMDYDNTNLLAELLKTPTYSTNMVHKQLYIQTLFNIAAAENYLSSLKVLFAHFSIAYNPVFDCFNHFHQQIEDLDQSGADSGNDSDDESTDSEYDWVVEEGIVYGPTLSESLTADVTDSESVNEESKSEESETESNTSNASYADHDLVEEARLINNEIGLFISPALFSAAWEVMSNTDMQNGNGEEQLQSIDAVLLCHLKIVLQKSDCNKGCMHHCQCLITDESLFKYLTCWLRFDAGWGDFLDHIGLHGSYLNILETRYNELTWAHDQTFVLHEQIHLPNPAVVVYPEISEYADDIKKQYNELTWGQDLKTE